LVLREKSFLQGSIVLSFPLLKGPDRLCNRLDAVSRELCKLVLVGDLIIRAKVLVALQKFGHICTFENWATQSA
jgi:hypothetical protein